MAKPGLIAALGLSLGLTLGALPIAAAAQAATKAPAPKTAAKPAAKSAAPAPPVVEPAALQALQKMGAYLKTLNTFELTAETSLDVVTEDGQRVTLDGVTDYKVRRPNGFIISVNSDLKKRTFYYDGKTFTVYSPELGYYASAAAPATIKDTLATLYARFGISLPLEDLFRWSDPSMARAETVASAFDVGPATIGGVQTEQYAFREGDIDWQVWIQKGDKPLPRKLVIVDRTDPAHPGYSARLNWNESPTLAAEDFTFKPGPDAKAIKLASAQQ